MIAICCYIRHLTVIERLFKSLPLRWVQINPRGKSSFAFYLFVLPPPRDRASLM